MRNPEHEVFVTAELYYCEALSKKEPAKDAINILRQAGASFWVAAPRFRETNPETEVDEDTGDLFAGIFHPTLERSYQRLPDGKMVLIEHRQARLGVRQSVRFVELGCEACASDVEYFDAIVTAQHKFVESHIPCFRPLYGWIDEVGENTPGDRTIRNIDLRFLFWCNIFGPAYVEKYGRDFLLDAPAWKATDLGEHGVSLTVCESFMQWLDDPCERVVEYFRRKVSGIKKFRAIPVRD